LPIVGISQRQHPDTYPLFGFLSDGPLYMGVSLAISLGARDVINDADDPVFLTIGITGMPGVVYRLSR
jgi:hypothetical protein